MKAAPPVAALGTGVAILIVSLMLCSTNTGDGVFFGFVLLISSLWLVP